MRQFQQNRLGNAGGLGKYDGLTVTFVDENGNIVGFFEWCCAVRSLYSSSIAVWRRESVGRVNSTGPTRDSSGSPTSTRAATLIMVVVRAEDLRWSPNYTLATVTAPRDDQGKLTALFMRALPMNGTRWSCRSSGRTESGGHMANCLQSAWWRYPYGRLDTQDLYPLPTALCRTDSGTAPVEIGVVVRWFRRRPR